jgi:vitamin B12 transporter
MSTEHSFHFRHIMLLLLASVAAMAVSAQSYPDSPATRQSDQQSVRQLDLVVITATKSPKKLGETGKVMGIVSREQIDQSRGKDLAQVLNEQTGITVSGANSNPGKDKTVFLRGASDKYTLILLDGVPLNDPSQVGGQYDIRLIPLSLIDHIEILKGSQSTPYGSSAVAGVINIITRKAESDRITGEGSLSYGSYNTLKGAADFNRRSKVFDYDLNYQYVNTDGISEAKDTTGKAGFPKNGFNQQAFQANLAIHPSAGLRIAPYFRYSAFKGSFSEGAFMGGADPYTASLINTGLTAKLGYSGGTVYANYGYDYTQRSYGGAYPSDYQGRFHHAEIFVDQRIAERLHLTAGLNFQSYNLVKPDTANSIISPYASFFYDWKGLHVELGGRYNHDNKYGNNFTYSFNPSYLVSHTVKLFVNISSGFRAPSVSELFGPYGTNPALQPEKAYTEEAGAQLFLLDQKLSFLADYFDRDVQDVIAYVFDAADPNGHYINQNEQHDHGIETELAYSPCKKLDLKASYTYVTGATTELVGGKDTILHFIDRVPKDNFLFSAAFRISSRLLVSSSLQFTGSKTDSYAGVTLHGYALWNAYAEYSLIGKSLLVFADLKNITNNTNYYEVYGYSVQGANLICGVHVKL